MSSLKINHLRIIIILCLVLGITTTAFAAGESVTINSFNTNNCTPASLANGQFTSNNGSAGVNLSASFSNNTQGTSVLLAPFPLFPSGTYALSMSVPAATVANDVMNLTVSILDGGGTVLAQASLSYYCGGAIISATGASISTISDPQPAFNDGRINAWDTGNPVVLYGFADGDSRGLDVYDADGSGLILSIPASTIDTVVECPDSNTLIYSDAGSGISLWRLTARASDGICPFQLNAPTAEAGKTYIVVFDDLFTNTYYQSWEQ